MHNSKLVALLRTLDPRDLRRLEDFLASPYFNKSEHLLAIYRVLHRAAPDFLPGDCDRYVVWEAAQPGRPGSDAEIASAMNALLRLAEQFLAVDHYAHIPLQRDIDTLGAYQRLNLDKHFRLQLKRIHERLDDEAAQTERHFLNRYQVAGTEIRYNLQRQARTYDTSLQQMVDYLDDFYLIARLRLTCELINRQSILSGEYDNRLAGELMAYLRNYGHAKVPTMSAYRIALRLLTGEATHADFLELVRLLVEEYAAIGEDEWREVFSYAQNYCIRQVKAGDTGYLKELFGLYRAGLEMGRLLEAGQLSAWKYKNIASVGLQVQEFDWVEGFIEQFRDSLPDEFRETAFAYNLADLQYHRGEYEAALKNLLRVEFSDIFYALGTRKMMLMIYFEQGATESMLSLISAFKLFLKRNQLISESNRMAYAHFVNLTHAIYRVSEAGGDLARVRAQVLATQPLVEEAWLLEQADRGYRG